MVYKPIKTDEWKYIKTSVLNDLKLQEEMLTVCACLLKILSLIVASSLKFLYYKFCAYSSLEPDIG
jgi:hypothetical protein